MALLLLRSALAEVPCASLGVGLAFSEEVSGLLHSQRLPRGVQSVAASLTGVQMLLGTWLGGLRLFTLNGTRCSHMLML